mmetsp:Transcript_39700/g.91768  ORF Transcript_39700/g.91768 Transcript_39700/m.91768 type:complete len:585 (+) Transcript_39700:42-1796(+)
MTESFAVMLVAVGLELLFATKMICVLKMNTFGRTSVFFAACKSWLWQLRSRMRRKPTRQEKFLESEVLKLRVSLSHKFLHAYAFLSLSTVVSMQQQIVLGRERWMTPVLTWTNLLSFSISTFYVLLPWLLRPSTLPLWYVLYMMLAFALMSPWHTAPEQAFSFSFIIVLFMRLPLVLMCSRTLCVLLLNFPFVLLMAWRASNESLAGSAGVTMTVWTECSSCAIVFAAAVALQSILSRRVAMRVQEKNATSQLGAAQSLLRLMCDAVVQLDASLCLKKPSPELAALLLKDSPRSLNGMKITDCMPSVEATRAEEFFTEFMSQDPSVGPAHAFHTRFVDSYASKLCAEIFQVKYSEMDGTPCHLVGIRDFTDIADRSSAKKVVPGEQPEVTAVSRKLKKEDDEEVEDGDSDDAQSAGTTGPEEERGTFKKVFVEIDMASKEVAAASAPMDSAVGLPITDLFPASHTSHLLERLQHEAISLEGLGEPLRGNTFSFNDLPLRLGERTAAITGSMQVVKTTRGPSNILFCFNKPRFGRKQKTSYWGSGSTRVSVALAGTPAQTRARSLTDDTIATGESAVSKELSLSL